MNLYNLTSEREASNQSPRTCLFAQLDYILIILIIGDYMSTATKVLTAHVPLSLAEKVEAMASRLERSRGWVIKQALAA